MKALRLVAVALLVIGNVTHLQAQDDVTVTALVGLARVSRDGGDATAAARYFEQARVLRPLSAAESAEYFWVLEKVDRHRALSLGREILRGMPADDNIREAAIGIAITLEDEAAVVALARDGVSAGKDRTLWHRRLAESHARVGRTADAADAYLAAAGSADGQQGDWLRAAMLLTSAERYGQAITAWQRVPLSTLATHPEGARLRLLALAKALPANEAAPEIVSWLATNSPDREVQSWLVDVWTKAGKPAAAYAATLPLTTGPDAERWLRRAAGFARSAGLTDAAAGAYERLVKIGRPIRTDYVALIELRLQQGDQIRALEAADALSHSQSRCDDQVLGLIDRIPLPAATDRLRAAAERLDCSAERWAQRVVDRAVAEKRFDVALEVVERTGAHAPKAQRLRGQLLLWTGAPSAAVAILEPFVAAHQDDADGRLALIDALRAVGRVDDAFAAATPLYEDRGLASDRLLTLAELSVDAGHPAVAIAAVQELPERHLPAGRLILGRAMFASGKNEEAAAILGTIAITELTPAAALVLLDATIASRGYDEARGLAQRLPFERPSWQAVALRALTIEMVAGSLASTRALRARICADETAQCVGAEAEGLGVLVSRWQDGRSPSILGKLTAYADAHRTDAQTQVTVAELLLGIGQSERAVAMLTASGLVLSRPGQTVLARALADVALAHHRSGREREALQAARQAMSYDLANSTAWIAAFDAAVATGSDEAASLAHDFAPLAAENPALLIAVGNHLSGLVQRSRDAAARRVIGMLEAVATQPWIETNLTQARLYAAMEEWTPALRSVDLELRDRPESREALRLRADLLGWSGQHGAAVTAYSEYLTRMPDDIAAQRQQARVAGWGGRYADANGRYALLAGRYPENRAIAAEAAAKKAFFAGSWHEAITAYDAWIAVEPEDSEARFERAVSLRSAGHSAAADGALNELAAQTGHRLAKLTLSRIEESRRPTAAVSSDQRSASGFGGTRLLTMQQHRGLLTLPVAQGTGRVTVSAGRVRADSDVRSHQGYRAEAATHIALSSRTAIDGGVGVWTFSSRTTAEVMVSTTWSGNDRVALTGGFKQQAIQENLGTVDNGLTARGPFAAVRVATPKTSVETSTAWQRLSDGNTRRDITFSASRVVSERLPGLRVISWGQSLGYGARRSDYFSPDTFVRLDAGAELTHLLQRPRFAGDRQSSITVAFVEGTDNHGVLYHHPTATAHLQLTRRVALNARAELIRSSTYRESSFFVGIDLANLANQP